MISVLGEDFMSVQKCLWQLDGHCVNGTQAVLKTSKHCGVCHKRRRYVCKSEGRYIGSFTNQDDAVRAYVALAKHGM